VPKSGAAVERGLSDDWWNGRWVAERARPAGVGEQLLEGLEVVVPVGDQIIQQAIAADHTAAGAVAARDEAGALRGG
jgi:hypothetical protein